MEGHRKVIPEPEDGKVRSTYSPPWAQKGFTGLIREAEECYDVGPRPLV